jgi:hypothetical protein
MSDPIFEEPTGFEPLALPVAMLTPCDVCGVQVAPESLDRHALWHTTLPQGAPMPAMQQNPDGTWTEATPLAYHPGYDAEIGGKGPYNWELYHATPAEALTNTWRTVARGRSRTHLGASLRLVLAKWRDQVKRHA